MSEPINSGFDDLWHANEEYVKNFKYSELTGRAARGLAIVTCMDSRINPLSVVGMKSGDAKFCAMLELASHKTYCVLWYWQLIY